MLLLFIGPSCSGKTTIEKELVSRNVLERIKSHTTRPKRLNETGNEYYFVDLKEFKTIDFVETTNYMGNYYGTAREEIKKTDNTKKNYVITVDKKGVYTLPNIVNCPVKVVGIDAPFEDLVYRMKQRGVAFNDARLNNIEKEKEDVINLSDIVINNSNGLLEESISIIQKLITEGKKNNSY